MRIFWRWQPSKNKNIKACQNSTDSYEKECTEFRLTTCNTEEKKKKRKFNKPVPVRIKKKTKKTRYNKVGNSSKLTGIFAWNIFPLHQAAVHNVVQNKWMK